MPEVIYQIAGGSFFIPGTMLLALAVIIGMVKKRRWASLAGMTAGIVGIAAIVVSAEALAWWFYVVWAVALLGWFSVGILKRSRLRLFVRCLMLAITLVAAGTAFLYRQFNPLASADFPRLYVIGDSITAGLGRPGERTWPAILRAQHEVDIVDYSHAGYTTSQAVQTVKAHPISVGVVLIEIGGNDILGKRSPEQFGADLDALVTTLQGPDRELVMFELPLFPFDNAYGIEQRRVARRYQIRLIPRRFLAGILASPGATVDGIHLSNIGQQKMAELVWDIVGEALETKLPARE